MSSKLLKQAKKAENALYDAQLAVLEIVILILTKREYFIFESSRGKLERLAEQLEGASDVMTAIFHNIKGIGERD